ncbi:MAG: phosphoribosylglycinamide formyltransferase [Trueperaceae bacterium]
MRLESVARPVTFPLQRPARLAVLASGRGSNLQALLEAFPSGNALGSVVLVLSNRPDARALERASSSGVEAVHVPWRSRPEFEAEAQRRLLEARVDVVCLAGFMRLLSPEFTEAWAGRLLNVHPSLLPAFPGLDAHGQALRAGVPESGCTVHLVDAGVDSGPIILQRRVPVLPDDDVDSLAERTLSAEHEAYPEAVRRLLSGEWS